MKSFFTKYRSVYRPTTAKEKGANRLTLIVIRKTVLQAGLNDDPFSSFLILSKNKPLLLELEIA